MRAMRVCGGVGSGRSRSGARASISASSASWPAPTSTAGRGGGGGGSSAVVAWRGRSAAASRSGSSTKREAPESTCERAGATEEARTVGGVEVRSGERVDVAGHGVPIVATVARSLEEPTYLVGRPELGVVAILDEERRRLRSGFGDAAGRGRDLGVDEAPGVDEVEEADSGASVEPEALAAEGGREQGLRPRIRLGNHPIPGFYVVIGRLEVVAAEPFGTARALEGRHARRLRHGIERVSRIARGAPILASKTFRRNCCFLSAPDAGDGAAAEGLNGGGFPVATCGILGVAAVDIERASAPATKGLPSAEATSTVATTTSRADRSEVPALSSREGGSSDTSPALVSRSRQTTTHRGIDPARCGRRLRWPGRACVSWRSLRERRRRPRPRSPARVPTRCARPRRGRSGT